MRTRAIVAAVLGISMALPAAAQEVVDLELVLAADGSGSIDDEELRLQREGYAAAVTHPSVLAAITGGYRGAIALAYVEWGAPESQHTIVDWTLIRNADTARAFANELVSKPRAAFGYNSISGALDYAVDLIRANAYEGLSKIIDVSGDGPNIGGRAVLAARDDAVLQGITANALAIKSAGGSYPGHYGEPLAEYYGNDVIGGRGSFVMVADRRASFAAAVRKKMLREIAWASTWTWEVAGRRRPSRR